jgi:DNA-binding protein HU-beta
MATLGKTDLAKRLAEHTEKTIKESEAFLEAFVDVVTDALKAGDEVKLIGFGGWSVYEAAAREGINPSTKAKIHIPATKRVKFSTGKALTEAVAPRPVSPPAKKAAPPAKAPSKKGK